MPRRATTRTGDAIDVRGEPVRFSFWPMRKSDRRWGLHSMVYTSDPWAIIESSIVERCLPTRLDSARSFYRQSQEFFRAAKSSYAVEARPLLYYYSFLNLAKAFLLTSGAATPTGRVYHGLKAPATAASQALATAPLQMDISANGQLSAYSELWEALQPGGMPSTVTHPMSVLMGQCLVGHRLWCEAAGRKERFICADVVHLREDAPAKEMWATIEVLRRRLQRQGYTQTAVLRDSGLGAIGWRVVDGANANAIEFEQGQPVVFTHRASDKVMDLVEPLKPLLHRTVGATEPYRRYYLYLCPPSEARIPQLLIYYAMMFYFGSITRYRPDRFLAELDGNYGAFIREFLATVPDQFLYSFACEFKQQEITRAAVV